MRYCHEHGSEDCDTCADETRLEHAYEELHLALQALVARLLTFEWSMVKTEKFIYDLRNDLAANRSDHRVEGLAFRLLEDFFDDAKQRARRRSLAEASGG